MRPNDQIGGFANVPICFEVALDRRRVSLREVLQFHVGQLLPLPHSPAHEVSIRAGNTAFGIGEILPGENKVLIRITGLTEPGERG